MQTMRAYLLLQYDHRRHNCPLNQEPFKYWKRSTGEDKLQGRKDAWRLALNCLIRKLFTKGIIQQMISRYHWDRFLVRIGLSKSLIHAFVHGVNIFSWTICPQSALEPSHGHKAAIKEEKHASTLTLYFLKWTADKDLILQWRERLLKYGMLSHQSI